MTDEYQPTEDQIAAVLEKTNSDPRKLAIAYLRAQKRARDTKTAFDILESVNDLTISTFTGDLAGAEKAVAKAHKTVRAHREYSEKKP